MSQFDFVLVAYSIILGVGLANLIGNVAWLVRERDRVTFSWIQAGWVVVTLLWLVAAWWDQYVYESKALWTWLDFLILLGGAAFIVLQADLVVPTPGDQGADEPVDLRRFWVDHRRPFLGAALAFWTVGVISNLRSQEYMPEFPVDAMIGQFGVQCVLIGTAMWRRERWVHGVVVGFFIVAHILARSLTAAGTLGSG